MLTDRAKKNLRTESFGEKPLTWVDHYGVYLTKCAVERHFPPGSSLKILDIGCGYHASLLVRLLPRLASATGIDLKISNEIKGKTKLSFIESSIEEALPALDDESFDVILILSVLEHVTEPAEILSHAIRLLKPGGRLMINVPTWLGKRFLEFSAFRLGWSNPLELNDHKYYFNIPDLWPMLVRTGFKPSHIRLYYHKFGLNLFGICKKETEGP